MPVGDAVDDAAAPIRPATRYLMTYIPFNKVAIAAPAAVLAVA